jgi:hypothetical protein
MTCFLKHFDLRDFSACFLSISQCLSEGSDARPLRGREAEAPSLRKKSLTYIPMAPVNRKSTSQGCKLLSVNNKQYI